MTLIEKIVEGTAKVMSEVKVIQYNENSLFIQTTNDSILRGVDKNYVIEGKDLGNNLFVNKIIETLNYHYNAPFASKISVVPAKYIGLDRLFKKQHFIRYVPSLMYEKIDGYMYQVVTYLPQLIYNNQIEIYESKFMTASNQWAHEYGSVNLNEEIKLDTIDHLKLYNVILLELAKLVPIESPHYKVLFMLTNNGVQVLKVYGGTLTNTYKVIQKHHPDNYIYYYTKNDSFTEKKNGTSIIKIVKEINLKDLNVGINQEAQKRKIEVTKTRPQMYMFRYNLELDSGLKLTKEIIGTNRVKLLSYETLIRYSRLSSAKLLLKAKEINLVGDLND